MRKEKEALALKKKFNLSQENIAKSLASDFVCSFFINKTTGRYIEYSSSDIYKSLNIPATGNNYFDIFENAIMKIVYLEDKDVVYTAFNKENILKVLEVDKSFTLTFRIIINDSPLYIEMKITDMINDDNHVVCGIKNVDAHMKRLEEYENYKRNSLTFGGIAEALASDYAALIYVNTKNDKYKEYYSSDRYKALGIPSEGTGIFSGVDGLKKHIYLDDLQLFLRSCNKENILNVLKEEKSYNLNIRILLNGEPVYCLIKITKMVLEDDFHVVIGISNVDEDVKRELKYNESINEAKDLAYKDSLTGLKSKNAYNDIETKINLDIINKINKPFAVVVCDINGLKEVNDTLGHAQGDLYIKSGADLIAGIFKNSDVYRIGGDEFVVIVEGNDFINRNELLEQIHAISVCNIKKKCVSIAAGMSEFTKEDNSVHDVFKRADRYMYDNKKEIKTYKL
ncbi:MAG: GGDEF domain-containing protein [Acholeplasmatales bacterium]|nr:GGDEF domain-containing protein [Acholeplasmatales bacterium]